MKRLFINLETCSKCPECVIACSYFYHPQNKGITSLLEYANFATICRHCEEAPCVSSCYRDALEKQPDGHLRRYKMRCTSCKSCTIACPFGIIYSDNIPYLDSQCDYCIGRADKKAPECLASCPYEAVEYKEVKEDPENNIYFVGDKLAVKTLKWIKEDIITKKK
ncbi:4Fe-4S dicluster domain-containing protein [Candidatus Omnitrophota bacterium]